MGILRKAMTKRQNAKSILLVVDDESSVCRALSRILGKRVDEIISAFSPQEAETVLVSKEVTHLVCDHWFGMGQPLGIDLVVQWKQKHPSIRHVVVLTGTDVTRLTSPGDDIFVMNKTVYPEDLIKVLNLD
jgi:DNA-binding NtrC family response regulator